MENVSAIMIDCRKVVQEDLIGEAELISLRSSIVDNDLYKLNLWYCKTQHPASKITILNVFNNEREKIEKRS